MRLLASLGLLLLAMACLALARGIPAPLQDAIQFRVVGASDRPQAQAVKRAVRDAILARIGPGLQAQHSQTAAWRYLRQELPAIAVAARAVAGPAGQSVHVHLARQAIPAHRMGWVAFSAGRAPALVVTLGAGQGHNWWTVLFPPLALVSVHGQLLVVGPSDGQSAEVDALAAGERARLAAAVVNASGGRLPVRAVGTEGVLGTDVQLRLAIWDAIRRLPLGTWDRRVLAWWGAF